MTSRDPYAQAGPWAVVLLPDGQRLRAVVTGRTRLPDGWWYELEAILWERVELPGGLHRAEPRPVALSAPADLVEPLEGEDYSRVPTVDETVAHPWRLVDIEHPSRTGPKRILHRGDCAQAIGGRRLTGAEALDAARDPDAAPCEICRPDRALHRT